MKKKSETSERTKTALLSFIGSVDIFASLGKDTLSELVDKGQIFLKEYSQGEIIYGSSLASESIDPAVIMQGSATVFSSDEGREVCLRVLNVGSLFGVANLFADADTFISTVKAEKKCSVVFIKQASFKKLLETESDFMYAYFHFLANRIAFLNRKIRQFTAGSAERRLAIYLDTISEQDSFILPFNYSKLCEMIDVGRASLYRALDNLTEKGIISREGKSITVIDRAALRKYGYNPNK